MSSSRLIQEYIFSQPLLITINQVFFFILPSTLSASTLKPSSLVISNFKCGWSLLAGSSSSSSDGGGTSSSEVEAAPRAAHRRGVKTRGEFFLCSSFARVIKEAADETVPQYLFQSVRVLVPAGSQACCLPWSPRHTYSQGSELREK